MSAFSNPTNLLDVIAKARTSIGILGHGGLSQIEWTRLFDHAERAAASNPDANTRYQGRSLGIISQHVDQDPVTLAMHTALTMTFDGRDVPIKAAVNACGAIACVYITKLPPDARPKALKEFHHEMRRLVLGSPTPTDPDAD